MCVCGALASLAGSFSIATWLLLPFLSFPSRFPLSSPLARGAVPFNLLPEGRSVQPSDQFAVDSPDSLAQDQAEEDRTNLTSKS